MRWIKYNENADLVLDVLKKGAFMTTMADNKINTMTIGWGNIGYSWGCPVFMAMVRQSRLTHDLIEKSNEFTITLPTGIEKSLGFCGSKSGRDFDKLKECGINTLASSRIATPTLDIKGIHYECSVIYKTLMSNEDLAKSVNDQWYSSDDYHTLYFAEILASYIIE